MRQTLVHHCGLVVLAFILVSTLMLGGRMAAAQGPSLQASCAAALEGMQVQSLTQRADYVSDRRTRDSCSQASWAGGGTIFIYGMPANANIQHKQAACEAVQTNYQHASNERIFQSSPHPNALAIFQACINSELPTTGQTMRMWYEPLGSRQYKVNVRWIDSAQALPARVSELRADPANAVTWHDSPPVAPTLADIDTGQTLVYALKLDSDPDADVSISLGGEYQSAPGDWTPLTVPPISIPRVPLPRLAMKAHPIIDVAGRPAGLQQGQWTFRATHSGQVLKLFADSSGGGGNHQITWELRKAFGSTITSGNVPPAPNGSNGNWSIPLTFGRQYTVSVHVSANGDNNSNRVSAFGMVLNTEKWER